MSKTAPPTDRAATARAVRSQRSAERAIDNPRELARATRIIRAALARQALELADVLPEGGNGDAA